MKLTHRWLFPVVALGVAACMDSFAPKDPGVEGLSLVRPSMARVTTGSTTTAGETWTQVLPVSSITQNGWFGVTYGEGLFVAVASSGGTSDRVMTSPDGFTWTPRTSAAGNAWRSVAYGNGRFVAVANSGVGNRVMYSDNGTDWTAGVSPADNNWFAVAYGNGLFVAVAENGTNQVMTSPDGITWNLQTSPVGGWKGVTYGDGLWVAVSRTGTVGNRVMTSPDGINWTARVTPTFQDINNVTKDREWSAVTYGEGLFVAVAQSGSTVLNGQQFFTLRDRVMTSPNGINWTVSSTPIGGSLRWNTVTYGDGRFVAVAFSGTPDRKGERAIYSNDGINWTQVVTPEDGSGAYGLEWRGVAYGNNRFVAVALPGSGNNAGSLAAAMVSLRNQSITINTESPASAVFNGSFDVAATATSGLPVSITTAGGCSGSGSGSATITMTSGSTDCTIQYNQAGDNQDSWNAAPQLERTVNATKASQSITVSQSAPAQKVFNGSFDVEATASTGLSVSITTAGGCSGSGEGSATITMTSGTTDCTVQYNQGGDADYNAAPEVTSTVTAQKASQTINVSQAAPGSALVSTTFTVAATATSNLSVSISASDACSASGSDITTASIAGVCTVSYAQAGNDDYAAATNVSSTTTVTTTVTTGPIYTVSGFFHPVDMGNVVNIAKAGKTIPLKFRVVDANGAPLVGLTLSDLILGSPVGSAATSATLDAIEFYSSGSSGLQYLGSGNYQFNWKTPTSFANSTRRVQLTVEKTGVNISNPNPITATFQFRR